MSVRTTHPTDSISSLLHYQGLQMATLKLLRVVNYAAGGVQQSIPGGTCARIAFHMGNRTKIRHSIHVNACH
jgi:hypothetical protein